jgi:hypothetical protein
MFKEFLRSLCIVVVREVYSGQGGRRFHSRWKQYTAFEWGCMAGGHVNSAFEWGGGWLAGQYKRRRAGQAGPYKIFLMWGGGVGTGLSGCSGRDTLESLHLHYAQEIISLSTILCVTRRTFYFFGFE